MTTLPGGLADRAWHVKIREYLRGQGGAARPVPVIAHAVDCTNERARLELAMMRDRGQVTREGSVKRGWLWSLTDAGRSL